MDTKWPIIVGNTIVKCGNNIQHIYYMYCPLNTMNTCCFISLICFIYNLYCVSYMCSVHVIKVFIDSSNQSVIEAFK